MDTFKDYLSKKKIDSETFRQADAGLWEEWKELFEQLHPDSFTAQKLFLINRIRRRFPMRDEETSKSKEGSASGNKDAVRKG